MDQKQQGQPAEGVKGQQEPQTQTPEKGRDESGGISNRDLDREMEEQEELPDRGQSQSER